MKLRFVIGLTLAATCAVEGRAWAIDTAQCLAASEKGQRARAAGKLREAKEAFQVCNQDTCPAIVRSDCSKWRDELQASAPSVVFGARDAKGHDLFDVTVSMDGEVVTRKLDGKAVTVDPGPHTFKLEAPGFPAVTEKALIKEGEKARAITVTFADPGGTAAAQTKDDPQPQRGADTSRGGGHTVLPWIVVGVGGVTLVTGLVVLLTAPDHPSNCDPETTRCVRLPDQTADAFAKDQEQAGKADSQPVLGGVIAGIGGALVVGGLVWHFLEPTDNKSGVRVSPWTTGSASGLTLGGSF